MRFYLICILALVACNNFGQSNVDAQWGWGLFYPVTTEYKFSVVLASQCQVYEKPDVSSKVVKTLTVNYDRYINVLREDRSWLQIDIEGKVGYVLAAQIGSHSFYLDDSTNIVFGTKSESIDSGLVIYKRSFVNKVLDSLIINKLSWSYAVAEISNCPMDKVEKLYKIKFGCKGCAEQISFVAYSSKTGLRLIDTVVGEDIYQDTLRFEESIYFPVKFGNDKIKLVQNGDVGTMLDHYLGELRVFDPPKTFNFPLKNIVVKKKHYRYYKNDILVNEKDVVNYYRWNGAKLLKLKF